MHLKPLRRYSFPVRHLHIPGRPRAQDEPIPEPPFTGTGLTSPGLACVRSAPWWAAAQAGPFFIFKNFM